MSKYSSDSDSDRRRGHKGRSSRRRSSSESSDDSRSHRSRRRRSRERYSSSSKSKRGAPSRRSRHRSKSRTRRRRSSSKSYIREYVSKKRQSSSSSSDNDRHKAAPRAPEEVKVDPGAVEEINREGFAPKQFKSKKLLDNIVIDLKKQTIKVPEVEPIEPDSIFHHNLFLNEGARMEKWIKELYGFRQKALQQGLKNH